MDLHRKVKKTRSSEQIGSMQVTGKNRRKDERKYRDWRKIYSSIKTQTELFRAAKKKGQVTYNDRPMAITLEFSMKTLKARRLWRDILQTLKDHECQPKL